MPLILLIPALAAAQVSATAEDEQIVGYYYACEATIPLAGGKLTGRRTLDETTYQLRENDFASWSAQNYEGISLSWSTLPSMTPKTLGDIPGLVQIYLRAQRRLPKIGIWAVRPDQSPQHNELKVPVMTAGDTRLGAATIPLDALVAYGRQASKLNWRLIDPRPDRNGRQMTYAEGKIDFASVREAFSAIPRLQTILDEMTGSPEQRCVRTPEFYNPDAEI